MAHPEVFLHLRELLLPCRGLTARAALRVDALNRREERELRRLEVSAARRDVRVIQEQLDGVKIGAALQQSTAGFAPQVVQVEIHLRELLPAAGQEPTVFEGRIQAGAQWVWTGSEFVHATEDQQRRFEAVRGSADAPLNEIGGWFQQMLFRGLSTETRATIDGRSLTIRSSVDDDGRRVWVTLGDEPSRVVLFAPRLRMRLSRAEYEQLLDLR